MKTHLQTTLDTIAYLEAHLAEDITLYGLAEAMHYSKFHLQRIFVDTVGISPHDYAQRRKLTEAARLLVFSERPILDIALLAGFRSQQAFTDAFKAMYKQTPRRFRTQGVFYPLQNCYDFCTHPVGGEAAKTDVPLSIERAEEEDIPGWMHLVEIVIGGYPLYEEAGYLEALHLAIREERALLAKRDGEVIGAMILARQTGSIDFFGIHPLYRKQDLAGRFLERALQERWGSSLHTTTFRAGDRADPGYRETLRALGFAEAELLVEFGYPTQRMVLQIDPQEKREDEHIETAEKDEQAPENNGASGTQEGCAGQVR